MGFALRMKNELSAPKTAAMPSTTGQPGLPQQGQVEPIVA